MIQTTNKILPFSGGRYQVTETSDVIDESGNTVTAIVKEGRQFVELTWYNGKKLYEKGLVVLTANKVIEHPDHLYDRIEVIYKDLDTLNCFSSNLTFRFSGDPIESDVEGFYLVPWTVRYSVSRDGSVFDHKTNTIKEPYTTKGNLNRNKRGGYKHVADKQGINFFVHRLIAITFLELPKDKPFSKLTVNHIDGNKSNNDVKNLEWITYSENNQHAWDTGLKMVGKPKFLVRDLVTGKITTYRSARDYASQVGDSSGHYVLTRLKEQGSQIYPDLLQFKLDDETPWPEIDSSKVPDFEEGFINNFIARNVFTGDLTIFGDARESETLFGIPSRIVLDHARNSKPLPYMGYNFRYLSERNKFPEYTKHHLEVFKETPVGVCSGVFVYDYQEKKEMFFPSFEKCLQAFDMKRPHLNTLLFTGDRYQKGRYQFRRLKLMEELRKDNQQPSSQE